MRRALFLLLMLPTVLIGQNALLDSLINSKNDTLILEAYNRIGFSTIFNDKEAARKALTKALQFAKEKDLKYGYNVSLNNFGIYHDVNGASDSARIYFEKSLTYSRKHQFLIHESSSLNNLGLYSWNNGKYEDALDYFFQALKLSEEMPIDKRNSLDNYLNNIGLIYQEMQLYEKAITYHNKALAIRIENDNYQGQASSYNNIGICYTDFGDQEKAKASFKAGMEAAIKVNEKIAYYDNSKGLADIYLVQNQPKVALKLLMESLNRPTEVALNTKPKIALLESIANAHLELNNPDESIKYSQLAEREISDSELDEKELAGVYHLLAKAYFKKGDLDKGSAYSDRFYTTTIERFKEENAEALQNLEARYETEKKEKKIAVQQEELLKNQLAIKNRNFLVLGITALLLIIAIVAFGIIKQQQFKRKRLQEELALKDALVIIQTQNKLQEQRLNISRDLHDNIGSQLTFIISSLDNLKYFEFTKDKLYQKFDHIGQFTRNTITELRDTIWAMNKSEITIDDLEARIANFINQANVSLIGIEFNFKSDPKLHNGRKKAFSSTVGMNIYRIIQESVNNAIKHSKSTTIEVSIDQSDHLLIVKICDNGVGINLSTVTIGNGINSINKRAKEIGGEIEIKALEQGTMIKLMLKNEVIAV